MSLQNLLQQWKAFYSGARYDRPVIPIVFDKDGNPVFLSPSSPMPTANADYSGGAFADQIRVGLHSAINEKFVYGSAVNPDHIIKDESGGGTVTHSNGMLMLQTGAATNKKCYFRTRRPLIYVAGTGNHCRFTPIINATGAGKYRECGVGTIAINGNKPDNAICFIDNGGVISFAIRKNGNITVSVPYANWYDKLDGTGLSELSTSGFQHGIPIEIIYPYLGFGDIYIYVIAKNKRFLVTTIQYASLYDSPFIGNPTLYPYGYVENTTANTNTTLAIGSIGGLMEADFKNIIGINYDTDLVSKANITTETPILSIHNPPNAFGGTNNNGIILKLSGYSISSDGTGSNDCQFRFYIHNNPVTGGSYADVLTGRSVYQVNNAPTSFNTANQRRVHTRTLDRPSSTYDDITNKGIYLYPNEYLTVTGSSASAFTGVVSLGIEEFQ